MAFPIFPEGRVKQAVPPRCPPPVGARAPNRVVLLQRPNLPCRNIAAAVCPRAAGPAVWLFFGSPTPKGPPFAPADFDRPAREGPRRIRHPCLCIVPAPRAGPGPSVFPSRPQPRTPNWPELFPSHGWAFGANKSRNPGGPMGLRPPPGGKNSVNTKRTAPPSVPPLRSSLFSFPPDVPNGRCFGPAFSRIFGHEWPECEIGGGRSPPLGPQGQKLKFPAPFPRPLLCAPWWRRFFSGRPTDFCWGRRWGKSAWCWKWAFFWGPFAGERPGAFRPALPWPRPYWPPRSRILPPFSSPFDFSLTEQSFRAGAFPPPGPFPTLSRRCCPPAGNYRAGPSWPKSRGPRSGGPERPAPREIAPSWRPVRLGVCADAFPLHKPFLSPWSAGPRPFWHRGPPRPPWRLLAVGVRPPPRN